MTPSAPSAIPFADLPNVLAACERQAARVAELPVGGACPDTAWTATETLHHLVVQVRRFTSFASCAATPDDDLVGVADLPISQRVAEVNRRLLLEQLEGPPGPLLVPAVRDLAAALRRAGPSAPFRAWEADHDVATAAGTVLAELLVHGRDVARAAGIPLHLDERMARLATPAVLRLVPHYLDPRRAGTGAVRFRVNGVHPAVLVVERRTARWEEEGHRAQATLRVGAVTHLLLATRRIGPWAAAARGMRVSGHRPDLVLRLPGWFTAP